MVADSPKCMKILLREGIDVSDKLQSHSNLKVSPRSKMSLAKLP